MSWQFYMDFLLQWDHCGSTCKWKCQPSKEIAFSKFVSYFLLQFRSFWKFPDYQIPCHYKFNPTLCRYLIGSHPGEGIKFLPSKLTQRIRTIQRWMSHKRISQWISNRRRCMRRRRRSCGAPGTRTSQSTSSDSGSSIDQLKTIIFSFYSVTFLQRSKNFLQLLSQALKDALKPPLRRKLEQFCCPQDKPTYR